MYAQPTSRHPRYSIFDTSMADGGAGQGKETPHSNPSSRFGQYDLGHRGAEAVLCGKQKVVAGASSVAPVAAFRDAEHWLKPADSKRQRKRRPGQRVDASHCLTERSILGR